tara:strand:+ start:157 stop:960 length:804 start_codon:yes stop_codon:yes gene_type:complete
MFLSPTVSLRKDPSTEYAHTDRYSETLRELKRFRSFLTDLISELYEVAKAQGVLDATVQKYRSSKETVELLDVAMGKRHLLLLDEWIEKPHDTISKLKEMESTWIRATTHQGWADPVGWNIFDILKAEHCILQMSVYLDRVMAKHGAHILQGPVVEPTHSMCRVGVSQLMMARKLQVLDIFRSCLRDLYKAFYEAWKVLKPSMNLNYKPLGGEVDWESECEVCGVSIGIGSYCVPVNGTRGYRFLVCTSCTPFKMDEAGGTSDVVQT